MSEKKKEKARGRGIISLIPVGFAIDPMKILSFVLFRMRSTRPRGGKLGIWNMT